jgi:hemerythrin superfamily protein
MDAIKLIKQDHRTVKGLFRKLGKATRRADRQKFAEQLIRELSIHAAVEEELLYPALRSRAARNGEHVLDALEEHHAVKLVLAEVDKMNAGDERHSAKMHVVRELVESHIEEEEQRLLPRLEKLFDVDEREVMGKAMLALKQGAPTHPHPGAPDTPPGVLVAGLVGKLSDTTKDLFRRLTSLDKTNGYRRVRDRLKAGATAAKRSRRSEGSRGASVH